MKLGRPANSLSVLAIFGAFAAVAPGANAQQSPDASASASEPQGDTIVVVGSNIQGKITEAVPVTLLTAEQLDAIAATNGDELIRSIPQIGDVNFNPSNSAQTTNAARGDVGSIDLRSLGVGNTLVLINGRRSVTHPSSQALVNTGSVPVLTYNSNALPTGGLGRVEILLDGGAALYGTDAVAGVFNAVTRSNQDGANVSVQYGGAEGTQLRELQVSAYGGKSFDWGNISGSLEYTNRSALPAEDQKYTATADLRDRFAVFPGFATNTGSDTRNTRNAWPNLQTPGANGIIRRGTTQLTSAAGAFYIRPQSLGACSLNLADGLCIVNRALQTTGAFRDLRYDVGRGVDVLPEVQRFNMFVTGDFDISDNLTFFGEVGAYYADSFRLQPPVINLNPIWIPASNYWNPFGPTTFANGSSNPNRLTGLTNVPAAGLPVRLDNYRFIDAGFQEVKVSNHQTRFLAGLRGENFGFDWNSAIVYSTAAVTDLSNNVDGTKLQTQLALSTPDAYNPFNGGCINEPDFGDCAPSSRASIDAITMLLRRDSETSLAMVDFRASRKDLVELPSGPVGVAFGVEFRRETQHDDRDANVDGTIKFVDAVTGEVSDSNVAAVSPNPDAKGARKVSAAYLEFAVPIVSEAWNIPLMRSLELQLAGRYEEYSDFGSIAKPKIAAAWDVFDGLRLRGSYSEGFRAPNLEQLNVPFVARNTTGQDYVRCEADLRARRITSFGACGNNLNFSRRIAGNPDLDPEESVNESFGLVFEPNFLPAALGEITFTVDDWRIEQTGLVGILGGDAALAQDYLARVGGGSNPNVVRAAPNADDVAFFAGTGLAPAGRVVSISDRYVNLQPQSVHGIDYGLVWELDDTPIGDFSGSINATNLIQFERDPGPAIDTLLAARQAGQINVATRLPASADLIKDEGRPEWRYSASLTWSKGPFQAGLFTRYVGEVNQTGFLDDAGNPWPIEDQLTTNLYVQYKTDEGAGWASGSRIRLGVRNLANELPPLTSDGYSGFLHTPYGRYWYVNLSKSF